MKKLVDRIRLLPILVVVAALLLMLRLGDLGVAVEVQMNGNEIAFDRRNHPFVSQGFAFQLVAEVAPTGPEDDQHRLIGFDRQLVSRLQTLMPLQFAIGSFCRSNCSKTTQRQSGTEQLLAKTTAIHRDVLRLVTAVDCELVVLSAVYPSQLFSFC